MKTLPVRFWLWLLLLAVVALPAATTLAFIVTRPPPPAYRVDWAVPPELRQTLQNDVARWDDPAWQESMAGRLAAAGLAALLIDDAGQVIYASPAWPGSASADAVSPAIAADLGAVAIPAPTGAGVALAVIIAESAAALDAFSSPPWFNSDVWRIPLAQMAALLLIVAGVAFFVHRAFLRPLAQMVAAMRRVGGGDLEARLPRSRVAEVDEAAAAFGAMAEALRASLERQAELEQERRMTISAVVHDLRTPLFSLRGYLEGLATGLADSPEKAARYVRVCREKADALERLVADLFAYTRTEYLEAAPRPEPLDLGELLRRTVEGMQPQAAAKAVAIALDEPGAPASIAGDPVLLMRAVENVLDNAVRYTPSEGAIRVSWRHDGVNATFTVADSGPGIAAADLPHVFTPLYRGESSRNRRTGGAGLGLAIARRLLRAHGGDLEASTGQDGGAVFTGTLPAHPAPPNPLPAPPRTSLSPHGRVRPTSRSSSCQNR